jgi:hypothetical protein
LFGAGGSVLGGTFDARNRLGDDFDAADLLGGGLVEFVTELNDAAGKLRVGGHRMCALLHSLLQADW